MTTLSNDSQLTSYAPGGVFADLAPDGTPTPYVIFTNQSGGNDSLTMNDVRVLANPLYQIIAVAEASKYAAVTNAASRFDDIFKPPASGTVTGGYISSAHREQPITKNELINTIKWKSSGGLYRLTVQQTT